MSGGATRSSFGEAASDLAVVAKFWPFDFAYDLAFFFFDLPRLLNVFLLFSFLHFDVVFVFRACGFEGPGPSESVASSFAASVVLVSISVELALEGSATLSQLSQLV